MPLLRRVLIVVSWTVLALLGCGVAAAGPVAIFQFEDGRVLAREIVDFGDGVFTLRVLEGGSEESVAEDTLKSIDFGEIPIELDPGGAIILPDGSEGLECLWWAVNGRHFAILGRTCYIERFLEGPERVEVFEQELDRRIATRTLRAEVVRDMRLARVEVLYALGEGPRARASLDEIRREHPGDEVVQAFVRSVMSRATRKREAGESVN